MSIFDYIDKYGGYTFDDLPLNDVDNLIFSSLAYVDFDGIVSVNRYNPLTLSDVGEIFFNSHTKISRNILAYRQAIKIFKAVRNTKRYGELLLYNYAYETKANEQFGAITFEINKDLVYVSFEGTDQMVSGWKEDFMLSYQFPVLSQRRAISYINRNFLFSRKKIIVGGHSKGGNLAIVAAMYANFFVRNRIIKIYNNDGPGLLMEQFNSKKYKRICEKLVTIVPDESIFGMLLLHSDSYFVVKSSKKGMLAHDLATWIVDDNSLCFGELTSFSKKLAESLSSSLKKYSKEERKNFVESLFNIFDTLNIKSFVDIVDNKSLIIKLIIEAKDIDKNTKYMLKEAILVILSCYKDVTIEELKAFFNRD